MTGFESLGRDCEFGLVQRICGAEPLGLFRFAGSKIDSLCRVLENRLDGFLTEDDLAFEIRDLEYMTYSRTYGDFHTHTLAYTHRDHEADVVARERKKANYLRKRFLSDWTQNQRIYVFCGSGDEAEIVRLLTVLEREAPCILLWVVAADEPHRRGQVERLRPRLLKAYLSHYATYHWGPRMDLPGWAQICFAVDAMIRNVPTPVRPPFFRRIAAEIAWSRAPCGLVESGADLGRCRVLRRRAHRVPVLRIILSAPFVEQARIVFSVWIWLPRTFDGLHLSLQSGDGDVVNFGNANPTLLEEWQQIWLVTKVASPTPVLEITVYVDADTGSDFYFAGAQVQEGPVPSEDLKPDGAPAWSAIGPAGIHPSSGRTIFASKWFGRKARVAGPAAEADRSAKALLMQGDALMRAGCFDEADVVLSAGTILWPWKADFFSHRGLCAEMAGDPALAAERWRELIRLFPDIAMGYHRRAGALRVSGDVEAAVAIIEAALADHADDPAVLAEAGRVYAAADRPADARAQWDRVIAEHGNSQDWLDERERLQVALATLAT